MVIVVFDVEIKFVSESIMTRIQQAQCWTGAAADGAEAKSPQSSAVESSDPNRPGKRVIVVSVDS